MLRHTCLRNEQNIVATKETLSRQSYHTEGKKNVAIKEYVVATQARMSTRSSSHERRLDTYNKDLQQRTQNSVVTQLQVVTEKTTWASNLGIHKISTEVRAQTFKAL